MASFIRGLSRLGQLSPVLLSYQRAELPVVAASVHAQRFFASAVQRPKDPERPKRPQSAWLLFVSHFRAKGQTPAGSSGPAVVKAASAEWKSLSEAQRQPFVKQAADAQVVYRKAMDEYVSSGKKDAWARDPEKPKRPITGFLRFAAEFRKSQPTTSPVTAVTKAAGAKWKAMTDAMKQPYNKAYTDEKAKYEKALESYKASGKEDAWKKKVGIAAIEDKQKAAEEAKKAKAAADKAKEAAKKEADKAKKAAAAAKKKEAAAKAADKKKAAAEKTTAKKKASSKTK